MAESAAGPPTRHHKCGLTRLMAFDGCLELFLWRLLIRTWENSLALRGPCALFSEVTHSSWLKCPPASQFSLVSQEGKGKIDINDLREACIAFNLPIDVWLLEQVFDYCDADRDGQINYIEFANFLNWKEKLPSGFADVPCEFFSSCVFYCVTVDSHCTLLRGWSRGYGLRKCLMFLTK